MDDGELHVKKLRPRQYYKWAYQTFAGDPEHRGCQPWRFADAHIGATIERNYLSMGRRVDPVSKKPVFDETTFDVTRAGAFSESYKVTGRGINASV